MKEQRIEFYEKTEQKCRPIDTTFICLDCPLGNWEYGYNSKSLEYFYNKAEEECKGNLLELDSKKEEVLDKAKYNNLVCYCTKKFQYTFKNDGENYTHKLFCEFKNEVVSNISTTISNPNS